VKGRTVRRFLLNFLIGIAIVAGLGYLLLQYAPAQVAKMLPQEWRDRLGERIERSFVKNAEQCVAKDGMDALKVMAERLTSADPNIPKLSVRVFNMPVVNAFALPGERLVITSKLVETADSPDEVAGVLAHEMGHAYHRHPETGLVRVVGLQVLISVATGGSGGDTISNLAGILTILSYSRDAERQADAFAQHVLELAQIDPTGLSRFFRKVIAIKNEEQESSLDNLLSMFNTHPGTQERIDAIKPLPASITARPALTAEEWAKLKKICDQKSQPSGGG
jgi:predicted Zn-dependent protease